MFNQKDSQGQLSIQRIDQLIPYLLKQSRVTLPLLESRTNFGVYGKNIKAFLLLKSKIEKTVNILLKSNLIALFETYLSHKSFYRRTGQVLASAENLIFPLHKTAPNLMTKCLFVEYWNIRHKSQ